MPAEQKCRFLPANNKRDFEGGYLINSHLTRTWFAHTGKPYHRSMARMTQTTCNARENVLTFVRPWDCIGASKETV